LIVEWPPGKAEPTDYWLSNVNVQVVGWTTRWSGGRRLIVG
jgi:hypothetical protein